MAGFTQNLIGDRIKDQINDSINIDIILGTMTCRNYQRKNTQLKKTQLVYVVFLSI